MDSAAQRAGWSRRREQPGPGPEGGRSRLYISHMQGRSKGLQLSEAGQEGRVGRLQVARGQVEETSQVLTKSWDFIPGLMGSHTAIMAAKVLCG